MRVVAFRKFMTHFFQRFFIFKIICPKLRFPVYKNTLKSRGTFGLQIGHGYKNLNFMLIITFLYFTNKMHEAHPNFFFVGPF